MLKYWTGLDGILCKHLFYEHCSAVLIKHISPKDFFYPSDWFTESNNCDIIAYILIYPNSIGVCRLDTCFGATNRVAREGLVDSILVAEETKHLELFFVQTQFIFNLSLVNDLKHLRWKNRTVPHSNLVSAPIILLSKGLQGLKVQGFVLVQQLQHLQTKQKWQKETVRELSRGKNPFPRTTRFKGNNITNSITPGKLCQIYFVQKVTLG